MSKNILIIDDTPEYCEMISEIIKEMDYDSDSITNPMVAVETFKQKKYDLVIADIKMPVKDGFQVYEEIHSIDDKIPFIFISGYYTGDAKEIEKLKPNVFIHKPFSIDELIEAIKKTVNLKY